MEEENKVVRKESGAVKEQRKHAHRTNATSCRALWVSSPSLPPSKTLMFQLVAT